ncbi:MAG: YidC/Oxa1 family membrane protein insertase [Clostridia bacterium]|nr:YidC/Oxa1 family membrane protein insertase [Clostridia bacterium]
MNIQFPSGSGIQGFVYWLLSQIMGWGWVSYAFAIVFFTLLIKLMMAPIDFLNRFLTRRTQIKQQALSGELADLQKTYGNDPMAFARARQALYQKNGVGGLGSSLVALASVILTMVIFFQVMGALGNISNYNIRVQYQELQSVYQEYNDGTHTEDELTAALNEKYHKTKIQAGWIKNIWQPDSPMAKPVMSVDEYNKKQPKEFQLTTDEQKAEYNAIFNRINTAKQVNGYFLLAVISAVTVFLSMKINAIIAKRQAPKKPAEKRAEPIITYSMRDAKQQNGNTEQPMIDPAQMSKIMMWTMPFVYVLFATMQTSAFAIYMIASSVVSTLLSVGFACLIDLIMRHMKQPEIKKDFDATVINPHAKYFKGGRK